MAWSVAELEQELDECGYDGNRIAREVAARYDSGRVTYVHKTGAQTPDKIILMLELEFRFLGPDAALVLGRWHLKRDKGDIGGVFTLVWQRFPEGWKIVHDHTSAVEKPANPSH